MNRILWNLLCYECPQFSDKGPPMKWLCFPKFYSPLSNWPWLRINPRSSLYVIYCLILTAWQWLMSFTCIPVQIEPNKSPSRKKGYWSFSFERSATFPPQADHVLVDLFSSAADGVSAGKAPPQRNTANLCWELSLWVQWWQWGGRATWKWRNELKTLNVKLLIWLIE